MFLSIWREILSWRTVENYILEAVAYESEYWVEAAYISISNIKKLCILSSLLLSKSSNS